MSAKIRTSLKSESQIKNEMKALLSRRGAYYVPVPQGAYGKKGDSDMVICYRGLFIAMEGKTHEGHQSGWQETRQAQVEQAGGIYFVGRSPEALESLLDEIDRRYQDEAVAQ